MTIIKIEKKTLGKIEQLELIISIICLLNDIRLSKTDIKVLAYYVKYTIDKKTDDMLIESGIVKEISALRNIRVHLLHKGFLKRVKGIYKTYEVALDKNFNFDDNIIQLLIKIDNT